MKLRLAMLAAAILATTAITQTGQAYDWLHRAGRDLGLGWSDGYHSRTGCQAGRNRFDCPDCQHLHTQAPPTWWDSASWQPSTNRQSLENPVHPAARSYDSTAYGSSLFRQPGSPALPVDSGIGSR